jgi:hypothetical protein
MSIAYPKRPKFFAHGFTRLLGKVCIGGEIGPETCWLLSYIAHTEDAASYRRPVSFFNEDLSTRLGMSISAMSRARDRATKAGWLVYIKGAKRKPPRYFVSVPEWALNLDDGAGDERPNELSIDVIPVQIDDERGEKAVGKREERGEKAVGKRQGSGRNANDHLPLPNTPLPKDNLPQELPQGGDAPKPPDPEKPPPPIAAVVPAASKPKARNPLFDAIAELSGLDPVTAGGLIGKAAASLGKAETPYTAADVGEFGRRFWEVCPYAARDNRPRPTVNEIEKYIGLIRANPPPRQTAAPTRAGPLTRGQAADNLLIEYITDCFPGTNDPNTTDSHPPRIGQ